MIRFIGVAFGVIDGRLVCIATSAGLTVTDMGGLDTRSALGFVASIYALRADVMKAQPAKAKRPALVMFDAAVDLELLLRDASPGQKDILFGLFREREDRNRDLPVYDPTTPEYKGIADVGGYRLQMLAGKIFKIARLTSKKNAAPGLVLYDVASYFAVADISQAAALFLGAQPVDRIDKNLLPLWREGLGDQIAARCEREARLVVALAEKVEATIAPLNLSPRQWYGPSAIAARCLHKWGARREAKKLTEKNSPEELIRAIDCAYFGGRVELIKTGTVKDVRTYDLNSAYAYATTLLARFSSGLRFTRRYEPSAPFSCWLVRYKLPVSATLGVLPTRHSKGGISFRREGRGYFWQPELDYLRQRYPDSFDVRWGYVGPEYEPVTFAAAVQAMYDYRNELRAKGDNGEKIIKLALSNLYGKFAQNTGSAYFQCRAWAGWITSFIRRLLLEAVTGIEDRVISFNQDAVHLQGVDASVPVGEALGEWKALRFAQGIYVSPGIYDLQETETQAGKSATRGANLGIDFERVAQSLSDRQVAELSRSFFVGWLLSRQARVKYSASYLQEVQENLDLIPSRLRARNYNSAFDWSNEFRDSTINTNFSGQLSARYRPFEGLHSGALRLKLKDRGWL